MIEIVQAATPEELAQVRALFEEYAAGLGISLCFQSFDGELRTLPGRYAPPRGRLLLARDGANAVGCVAIREIEPTLAELKRLYVRPCGRGSGLGRRLTEQAIAAAREIGYAAIRLDTLHSMVAANRLYDALGFREIAPYYDNPHDRVRYLELSM